MQKWFRATYGTLSHRGCGNYFAGLMSEAENNTIAEGVHHVVMDYFDDAVDRNGSTELVFRSGSTRTIQPGSWIVNCTGYLARDTDLPYEPYVSASGAVASIHPRSWILHLPAFHGYYLAHLMFLDKLREVPLYEVDMLDLRRQVADRTPVCAVRARPAQSEPHLRQRPASCLQRQPARLRCLVSTAAAIAGPGEVHAHPPSRPRARAPHPRHRARAVRYPVRALWI